MCFVRIFQYIGISQFIPSQYKQLLLRRDTNKQRRRNNNWKFHIERLDRRKKLKRARRKNSHAYNDRYKPHNKTVVMGM